MRRSRASNHKITSHNRVVDAPGGESETRLDVLRFEIRQLVQHLLTRLPRREQIEYIGDTDAHAPDAGAASALPGVHRDPLH